MSDTRKVKIQDWADQVEAYKGEIIWGIIIAVFAGLMLPTVPLSEYVTAIGWCLAATGSILVLLGLWYTIDWWRHGKPE